MPNKIGAPTKFTDEVKEKIIIAIRKGAPIEIACEYAGIDDSTYCNWQIKAKKEQIPDFVEFFEKVKEAKGHTALMWLDKIDKAMTESWQAAAWKLERRYNKYFSVNAQSIEYEQRLNKLEQLVEFQKKDNCHGLQEAEERREETEEEILRS